MGGPTIGDGEVLGLVSRHVTLDSGRRRCFAQRRIEFATSWIPKLWIPVGSKES